MKPMKKPYVICHMMTAVDGRIDCAMTEQLPGVQEYYSTLDSLAAPGRVSGRVTAQLEMASPGTFEPQDAALGHESFSRNADADGGHINAAFLAAGLLDEVSVLIGAGIDGRGGMAAMFDGLPMNQSLTQLHLESVKPFESGAVWLRYTVRN